MSDTVVAEFELRLSQAAVEKAVREAEAGGQRITTAVSKGLSPDKARENATAYVAALERTFKQKEADLRESVARGLLTPADARKRGEQAARDFNAGVLSQIKTLGDAGALSRGSGQDVYVALAGKLKDVGAAGVAATTGVGTMKSALFSLASQATGAGGSVGALANGLLTFGAGGPIALGVVATIGAVTLVYRELTRAAREAAEKVDGLIASLRRQRDAENQGIEAQTAAASKRLHDLQSGRDVRTFGQKAADVLTDYNAGRAPGVTAEQRRQREIRELTADVDFGDAALRREIADNRAAENAARQKESAKNLRDAAKAAHELEAALKAAQRAEEEVSRTLQKITGEAIKAAEVENEAGRKALRAEYDNSTATIQHAAGFGPNGESPDEQILSFNQALDKLLGEEYDKHIANARAIEQNVAQAIDLANAFGIVDATLGNVLQGANAIATNFKGAITKGPAQFASILGVASGVGAIATSLFGESPEDKARKQATIDNTQALKDLAAHIVQVNLTGTQQLQAQGALSAFAATRAGAVALHGSYGSAAASFDDTFTKQLTAAAATVGLSFKQLTDIADALHINLDGTSESIKTFQRALNVPNSAAVQTYAGKQSTLQDTFFIQGIDDADQQLIQTVALLMDVSPVFAAALAPFVGHLDTKEGRAGARAAIQAVYARAISPKGIAPGQRGKLDPQQIVEASKDIIGRLNAADAQAPKDPDALTPNRALASVSQITAGGADLIASQLGSSNAFLSQIAASTAAMATASAGAQGPPAFAFTFQPGSVTVEQDGTVSVNDTLVSAVNQALGASFNRQAGNYGSAVMTG